MIKLTRIHRFRLPFFLALASAAALIGGCAGLGVGSSNTEFMYLATGTNIVQFGITSSSGLLTELTPNTVASVNAVAIATTSDSRYAYAVNKGPGNISQYSINGDGTLKALTQATVPAGTSPVAIAINPAHTFVYVLNEGDNTIGEYSIGSNGSLLPLSPPTVPFAANGTSLVITPNGSFLYATSYTADTVTEYSIGANGQLSALGTATVDSPQGPAVSPSGAFLYVPSSSQGVYQFKINADGSLTALSPGIVSTGGVGNDAAAVTPNGAFVYVGVFNGGFPGSPVAQFSVNSDGTLAPLTPPTEAAGNAPYAIGVDQSSKFAYVANSNDGTLSLFSVGGDGTLTPLSTPTINPNGALQMAFAFR